MTKYQATIDLDTINKQGERITTFVLTYPRFIHSEFMTHRVFSRNAASSRAIPFERMVNNIRRNMAQPVYWGKNQKGMQAVEQLNEYETTQAIRIWESSFEAAVDHATKLYKLGVHKQIVNRIIEPYMMITTIVTATEWDNFFNLRTHKDAQPEIQHLARLMKAQYDNSQPRLDCEVHIPMITEQEREDDTILKTIFKSIARCARVSYLNHDNLQPSFESELTLVQRLSNSTPIHASPFEHQAISREFETIWRQNHSVSKNNNLTDSRNLSSSWIPFRSLFEHNPTLWREQIDKYINSIECN